MYAEVVYTPLEIRDVGVDFAGILHFLCAMRGWEECAYRTGERKREESSVRNRKRGKRVSKSMYSSPVCTSCVCYLCDVPHEHGDACLDLNNSGKKQKEK